MHVITFCKHKNTLADVSFLLPLYSSVTKSSILTAMEMLILYLVVEQ